MKPTGRLLFLSCVLVAWFCVGFGDVRGRTGQLPGTASRRGLRCLGSGGSQCDRDHHGYGDQYFQCGAHRRQGRILLHGSAAVDVFGESCS